MCNGDGLGPVSDHTSIGGVLDSSLFVWDIIFLFSCGLKLWNFEMLSFILLLGQQNNTITFLVSKYSKTRSVTAELIIIRYVSWNTLLNGFFRKGTCGKQICQNSLKHMLSS